MLLLSEIDPICIGTSVRPSFVLTFSAFSFISLFLFFSSRFSPISFYFTSFLIFLYICHDIFRFYFFKSFNSFILFFSKTYSRNEEFEKKREARTKERRERGPRTDGHLYKYSDKEVEGSVRQIIRVLSDQEELVMIEQERSQKEKDEQRSARIQQQQQQQQLLASTQLLSSPISTSSATSSAALIHGTKPFQSQQKNQNQIQNPNLSSSRDASPGE